MSFLLILFMSSENVVVTGAFESTSHFLVRFKILPDGVSARWLDILKERLRAPDIAGHAILYETDVDWVLIGSGDPGQFAQRLKKEAP